MKRMKSFTAMMILSVFSLTSTYAAVDTVSCDSNPEFAANACDQCFSGGEVSVGDNKGLLSDVWENNSEGAQLLYKEEQDMPNMLALGGASWVEVKASDDVSFWQYPAEFDALYDEENLGYKLNAGQSVTWLESTLGSAYQLTANSASEGEAVGILIYDIATHALSDGGIIDTNTDSHRECVLYTSGEGTYIPPVVPETPELPQTGSEHILLALVALMLGFGFLKFRKK